MYGINCFTYAASGSCLLISKERPFAYTGCLELLRRCTQLVFYNFSFAFCRPLHHLPSLLGVQLSM